MKSKYFNSLKKEQGLTLIELLVVIVIVGLLVTIAVLYLSDARMKSRDARRLSDLNNLRKAVDLYAQNQALGRYPVPTSWANFSQQLAPYLANLPLPPQQTNSNFYFYSVNSNDYFYYLGTTLEDSGHSALSEDNDYNRGTILGQTQTTVGITGANTTPAPSQAPNCTDSPVPIYCLLVD